MKNERRGHEQAGSVVFLGLETMHTHTHICIYIPYITDLEFPVLPIQTMPIHRRNLVSLRSGLKEILRGFSCLQKRGLGRGLQFQLAHMMPRLSGNYRNCFLFMAASGPVPQSPGWARIPLTVGRDGTKTSSNGHGDSGD